MKAKALLICLGLAVISLGAQQDTVRFTRVFKEGEKDTYKMHMAGMTQGGDFSMDMEMSQAIKKVYENGDADMEISMPKMTLSVNGSEFPAPEMPTQTLRVNKNGIPTDVKGVDAAIAKRAQFMKYMSSIYNRDFKVGEEVKIDTTDPDDPKAKTTGVVKLESITDGVAKVTADLQSTSGDVDGPMKIKMMAQVDTASSKLNRMEASIDRMPITAGVELTDVKMTIERAKA